MNEELEAITDSEKGKASSSAVTTYENNNNDNNNDSPGPDKPAIG
jgi:hypothetical protein